MTQFRGNDSSKSVTIINNVPLRYSSVFLLPTITGCVFFILGFFIIFLFIALFSAIFDIPFKNLTNNQILFVSVIYIFSAILALIGLTKLFNMIFNKKVSLYDEDEHYFMIVINHKQFAFKKSDIKKVRLIRNNGKASIFSEGRIVIKLKNKNFRFSSDKNYNALSSMEQHLNQWKTRP